MENRYGEEEWFQPSNLILHPFCIFEKFSLAEKYGMDVELMQRFFTVVRSLKTQNKLCGYFLFNFDFSGAERDDPLEVKAAFVSKDVIKIIELVDAEENIEVAQQDLVERIEDVKYLIDSEIPVEGVIVFSSTGPGSLTEADTLHGILYVNELNADRLTEAMLSHQSSLVGSSGDVKKAMARLLYHPISHGPKCKEEAICEFGMWLFYQSDNDTSEITRISYNSIKLTEDQKGLLEDLLELCEHQCTILSGAYGVGKTVVIVSAIKELIIQNSELKFLFISAQSLLCEEDLQFSPFLEMVEKWIAGLFRNNERNVNIYKHTDQLRLSIDSLEAKAGDKGITFTSYLLKHSDLRALLNGELEPENFNVIILEETHGLDLHEIEKLTTSFSHLKKPKVWISSNSNCLKTLSSCRTLPKKGRDELRNLRNTPEIVEHAEKLELLLIPERYPSKTMLATTTASGLGVDCIFEIDNEKRIERIVELAENWDWIPNSDLLFIDTENSSLFEKLQENDILVYRYNEGYQLDKFLFLNRSDPIEAVVTGAEWHVLIVHARAKTLNAIEAVEVFSKRIVSRATTKLYLFLDFELSDMNTEVFKVHSDSKVQREVNVTVKSEEVEVPKDNREDRFGKSHKDRNVNKAMEVSTLIDHIEKECKTANFTQKKTFIYRQYRFVRIQHLPDPSLMSMEEDIYLVDVQAQEEAFVLQITSDGHHHETNVITAKEGVKFLTGESLPAYCNGKLECSGSTENYANVSKWLDLLDEKDWDQLGSQSSTQGKK